MTQDALVPTFFLYGEPPRADGGQFVHLEPLVVRNRPNNWNIRPHSHQELNHVMFISAGGGQMNIEGQLIEIVAPAILLVPPRMIHSFHMEPESVGSVLNLSNRYLDDIASREPGFRSLFELPFCCTLREQDGDVALFDHAFTLLARELNWAAPGHSAAVDAHLTTILVQTLRLALASGHAKATLPGPQARIVARFRAEVDDTYRHPPPLARYAARLGISVKQLRAACLNTTGEPPIKLILERRMLEARRLLLYSNVTVTEAAYHLGYDDPAYFTRIFSRHVGCSPRSYRHRQSALEN